MYQIKFTMWLLNKENYDIMLKKRRKRGVHFGIASKRIEA